MTTRDDVQRLETEFADAMQRMYVVGNGLARLRADLEQRPVAAAPARPVAHPAGGHPTPAHPVPHPAGPPRPAAAAASSGPGGHAGHPVAPAAPRLAPREPWYRREGAVTRVLAVSGAVVTLAGVAMLLVIAVRQGWFGPAARVTAGALLAALLGTLGTRGGARDRARGEAAGSAPVALVATGVAAALLDVVAVTVAYAWVPPVVGLLLCAAVAAAGLRVARTWSSDLLAVLVVVGTGVFAPVVAGEPGWVLSALLAVLAAAAWWARSDRPGGPLAVVRTVPVALSLLVAAVAGPTAVGPLLAVAVLTTAGTLAVAVGSPGRRADVASSVAVGIAVVPLVVAAAQSSGADTLAQATVAAALLLLAVAATRSPLGPLPGHLVGTLAAGGALAAVVAVVDGAPARLVGTGLLLLALGHAASAGAGRSRLGLWVGGGLSVLAVLAWLPRPVAAVSVGLTREQDLPVGFVDSCLVVALAAVLVWAVGRVPGLPGVVGTVVRTLGLGAALGATTTASVAVGTLAGLRLGSADAGFTAGHAVATVGWMVAAAALLLHSLERGPAAELALRLGLAVTALAVAKLFLFDLAALDGVVRSLAFLGTGLVLLATGSRYSRAWERSHPRASDPAAS
ncbi:DUF2339 domain-containing protein [Phycicoccus sp. BSK3Z-2]|uniref:DUF2339 domain-containing protein n=1 Tax=Phycicoccus avicenniae TaxID=2828860 RepID=A0A941HZ93_9MICO|nr:DUF2339 domain-containing protein [Phycicoccus avicenniae]MBR7741981.1 DUF2339 domain-containing protein [Phycicoccus avicenniae]